MVGGGIRSLAVMGGLALGCAALAGCGGGAAGRQAGAPADATTTTGVGVTTTTPPAATTTAPAATTTAPAVTTTVSTATSGGGPVLIVRGLDGSVGYNGREPATIDFSGDATNIVGGLTWSTWGPATAVGHGSLGLNNCKPNCAQGTVTQVPATINLSGVVNSHFTAMTEKAGSLDRSYSYPSNWATDASTTAGNAGRPACATSQLAASVSGANGAAGTIYYKLALRNTGSGSCVLGGYPGVSFVAGSNGHQVGAAASRVPGSALVVTLASGATAQAQLGVAEASNFGASCGLTTVRGLRVYPPNQTTALFVPHTFQACSNTSDVTLRVGPMVAAGKS